MEQLGRVLNLPEGWDSYGAKKIDLACVASAIDILLQVMHDETPPPAVVPTSCGGLQLEWHALGMDLELEIRSPALVLASYENLRTEEAWDERVFDFRRVRLALREMARSG